MYRTVPRSWEPVGQLRSILRPAMTTRLAHRHSYVALTRAERRSMAFYVSHGAMFAASLILPIVPFFSHSLHLTLTPSSHPHLPFRLRDSLIHSLSPIARSPNASPPSTACCFRPFFVSGLIPVSLPCLRPSPCRASRVPPSLFFSFLFSPPASTGLPCSLACRALSYEYYYRPPGPSGLGPWVPDRVPACPNSPTCFQSHTHAHEAASGKRKADSPYHPRTFPPPPSADEPPSPALASIPSLSRFSFGLISRLLSPLSSLSVLPSIKLAARLIALPVPLSARPYFPHPARIFPIASTA